MSDSETFPCPHCSAKLRPHTVVQEGLYAGNCQNCQREVVFRAVPAKQVKPVVKPSKPTAPKPTAAAAAAKVQPAVQPLAPHVAAPQVAPAKQQQQSKQCCGGHDHAAMAPIISAAAAMNIGTATSGKPSVLPGFSSTLTFVLNGNQVSIDNPDPTMTLNEYIRNVAGLKGTRKSCGEGGCGACVVVVADENSTYSVNSCLRLLGTVQGMNVTTIEGIGSRSKGYHPIQRALADHNGSQCGFCSPGMVMSMYGLLQKNPHPTKQQVEDNFDGNLCRCTGYRPILDAMKSFAIDSDGPSTTDIEDFHKVCQTPCAQLACAKDCAAPSAVAAHFTTSNGVTWIRPITLAQLYNVMRGTSSQSPRLVFGNTSAGIYKNETASVYIDLSGIPDLRVTTATTTGLQVGAAVTVSGLIDLLQAQVALSPSYAVAAAHLLKIANVPVRNAASWAGNIMLTHNHDHFPSDVFVVLAGLGAKVTIGSAIDQSYQTVDMFAFLQMDMTQRVLLSVNIPVLLSSEHFNSYKVMVRHQNSHAYVNAAFRIETDTSFRVLSTPTLVFGGIGAYAISASNTASFLVGKSLNSVQTLQNVVGLLRSELVPDSPPGSSSPVYRQNLAIGLFYKALLSFLPGLHPEVISGGQQYIRPVSSGEQSFDTNPAIAPVSEPISKVEGILQTSGEARFVTDRPIASNTLYAAFVLAPAANATLINIDWSAALASPGVKRYICAADLPLVNNFVPVGTGPAERIFVAYGETIDYAGQAVGVVLADSQVHADAAARLVVVYSKSLGQAIYTIDDAVAAGSFFDAGLQPVKTCSDIDAALAKADHVVSGEVSCGSQYHFYMETQSTEAVPTDDGGIEVASSTQVIDFTQRAVAQVTGIDQGKIRVKVMRLGGAYGGKLSRCLPVSTVAALAANMTQQPVRVMLDLNTNMKMLGKRHPFQAKYSIGYSNSGILQACKIDFRLDCGNSPGDAVGTASLALVSFDNCYSCPNWQVTPYLCKTNLPANTYTRAPGTYPAIYIMEMIMDHVAQAANIAPELLRQQNLYQAGQVTPYGAALPYCSISSIMSQLTSQSNFAARKQEIVAFNNANRWQKRGIAIAPVKYGIAFNGSPFSATVTVFTDGTVSISHGGIEMGQGLHTKVTQVVAYKLQVPIDQITIEPSNVFNAPQNAATGGSVGSELACMAVTAACDTLLARMLPVRDTLTNPTWKQWVAACATQLIELCARGYVAPNNGQPFNYQSYGAVVTEVLVDVITGELQIPRVDMLFDCGQSLSPLVDIGQCEGGFVMGLGYMTCEKLLIDETTGQLISDGTWEYKVPGNKDIPIDFRVSFLQNAPNPIGFLGSKASGEPPLCLSGNVLSAMTMCVTSALADAKKYNGPVVLSAPMTPEATQLACGLDPASFYF